MCGKCEPPDWFNHVKVVGSGVVAERRIVDGPFSVEFGLFHMTINVPAATAVAEVELLADRWLALHGPPAS